MPTKIDIRLENYPGVYYAGETINGQVQCTFTAETPLKGLNVQFIGQAETEWTETRTKTYYVGDEKKEATEYVRHQDEEEYFNVHYTLMEGENVVSAGIHSYPFTYVLPNKLPSSFEGSHGNVRYFIRGKLTNGWNLTRDFELKFNVDMLFNLNYYPQLRNPIETSVDSTPCSCWCQNTGPITFNMSLPVTGFTPDQQVHIGAYVENMSNLTVPSVHFKIIARYEYLARSSSGHQYEIRTIAEGGELGIGAHGEKSWTTTLNLPAEGVNYPKLVFCHIIKIRYYLKAKVILPSPHINLRNEISVVIGNVPLSGVNVGLPEPPSSDVNASAPPYEGPTMENEVYRLSTVDKVPESGDAVDAPPSYDEIHNDLKET